MAKRCALASIAVLVLAAPGCGTAHTISHGTENGSTVRGYGLSLELPPGWHGDLTRREIWSAPTMRAATFALSGPLRDIGQQPQRAMGDDDILVSLVDYGALSSPNWHRELPDGSLPIAVDRSGMDLFEGFREPVAKRAFKLSGHVLQVWVVFGSAHPSDELFRRANEVLATLSFEPDLAGSAGDVGGAP